MLTAQIPTAEFHVVEDCKHSVKPKRPFLAATLVRHFSWTGHTQGYTPSRVWPAERTIDRLARSLKH